MKKVLTATTTITTSHQNVAEFRILNMPNSDAESIVFMAFILIYSIITQSLKIPTMPTDLSVGTSHLKHLRPEALHGPEILSRESEGENS
jgi:hypothetical protein